MKDENGSDKPLRRYNRETIVISLPENKTIWDYDWFGVYCEEARADLGSTRIPQKVKVPPSPKMLGVKPEVRTTLVFSLFSCLVLSLFPSLFLSLYSCYSDSITKQRIPYTILPTILWVERCMHFRSFSLHASFHPSILPMSPEESELSLSLGLCFNSHIDALSLFVDKPCVHSLIPFCPLELACFLSLSLSLSLSLITLTIDRRVCNFHAQDSVNLLLTSETTVGQVSILTHH